jgi:hypothetical protein
MSYIPPSDSQYILNASGNTINPATEEAIILLRRMVKLMEPLAVQDSQQRQRVTVENSTIAIGSGLINSVNNIAGIGGVDPRFQFIDAARMAYATGIRNNLIN